MEFRVLGSIEVWIDDHQLKLSAKQQAVLAAGLVAANRVISVARLVDATWGDDPPTTATALIHTYVHALRRVLHRPGQPEIIVTRLPGYLVRVEPGQLDLHRFEDFVAKGRAAAAQGRDRWVAMALRAGLDLWRGPALEGLNTPVLRTVAARLDEMRLLSFEDRVSADLRLGSFSPLIAELTGLVAEYPLRERLRGQLMLALYQLGRSAEALEVYRQGRALLSTELGIEPGPVLASLHQMILRGDPITPGRRMPEAIAELVAPTAAMELAGGPTDEQAPSLAPSQLPPAIDNLAGRRAETAELCEVVASAPWAEHPVVCAISGKAGSGKTTLALHVAHLVRSAFPDGQLFARMHGGDPGSATQPRDVAGAFLRAFGMDPAHIPEATDERTGLLRSVLAERRVLIVLDEAESEAQVRPLLPAQAGCAVLITSRASLVGLDCRASVVLDVLDEVDAISLLAWIAGAERVSAEPAAAEEIVRLCGWLPLAVRIAGARLAARRQWPLSVLAARLRDEYGRLDELAVGDLEVRASLEMSYRGVSERGRRAFRRLGVLGLPDFSPWLLAPLIDVPVREAQRLADRLADAQLLDLAGVGSDGMVRYRMHDLIRLYARERAMADEPTEARYAALRRVLHCLLSMLSSLPVQGRTRDTPQRHPLLEPEYRLDPAFTVELLRSPEDWLQSERWTLVTAVERASELGLHEPACDLAALLLSSLRLRNGFAEWWRSHDAALAAARAAGDRRSVAMLLFGLGQLRYEQDRFDEAGDFFAKALAINLDLGDRRGEADCLTAMAAAHSEQGHFAEQLRLLPQAIAICREVDDCHALAKALHRLGYVYRDIGRFSDALDAGHEALSLYRQAGDRRGEGLALRSIGLVHRAIGELADAEELFGQAIEVFEEIGDRLLAAYGVQALAKVHIRQGRYELAGGPLNHCLEVCNEMADNFGTALMLRTLGELHLAAGDLDQALSCLTTSAARWQLLDLPLFRARTQRDLANVHERRGDVETAHAVRALAMETFRELGSREYGELRVGVGSVLSPAEPAQ